MPNRKAFVTPPEYKIQPTVTTQYGEPTFPQIDPSAWGSYGKASNDSDDRQLAGVHEEIWTAGQDPYENAQQYVNDFTREIKRVTAMSQVPNENVDIVNSSGKVTYHETSRDDQVSNVRGLKVTGDPASVEAALRNADGTPNQMDTERPIDEIRAARNTSYALSGLSPEHRESMLQVLQDRGPQAFESMTGPMAGLEFGTMQRSSGSGLVINEALRGGPDWGYRLPRAGLGALVVGPQQSAKRAVVKDATLYRSPRVALRGLDLGAFGATLSTTSTLAVNAASKQAETNSALLQVAGSAALRQTAGATARPAITVAPGQSALTSSAFPQWANSNDRAALTARQKAIGVRLGTIAGLINVLAASTKTAAAKHDTATVQRNAASRAQLLNERQSLQAEALVIKNRLAVLAKAATAVKQVTPTGSKVIAAQKTAVAAKTAAATAQLTAAQKAAVASSPTATAAQKTAAAAAKTAAIAATAKAIAAQKTAAAKTATIGTASKAVTVTSGGSQTSKSSTASLTGASKTQSKLQLIAKDGTVTTVPAPQLESAGMAAQLAAGTEAAPGLGMSSTMRYGLTAALVVAGLAGAWMLMKG